MELENHGDGDNIEKFDIKLKSKPRDGVILQLHHTIRGSNGESRRIRFSIGAFEDSHEKLACADNIGNIFVLDLGDSKFWKLKSQGPCSAMIFVPRKLDTLVIANAKTFAISFVDSDTGEANLLLTGHSAPVKHIAFSNNKVNNMLTASPVEAILWELRNYTKYFTLNTYSGAKIQQILFTPGGDYLVACFQNDTVQIWRHATMKSVKQIIPRELKHMRDVAFTMNGRAMAIAGLTPILILFSMDTWKSIRSIDLLKYKISGVQQIAFIPQMFDGGANKVLAILSSDCVVYFLDLESLKIVYSINPESSGIRKFVVSPSGKHFLCILQLGEVNIYKTTHVMDLAKITVEEPMKKELPSSSFTHKSMNEKHSPTRVQVEEKMRVCMDGARLRRILMQYGEYPDKFRSIIWRSLLATPRNKKAYSALVERGIHPTYKDIEKQFTIHSSITLKNLKRLLSCLAHWCPLFGVMKFMPSFVFPFVKVLQKDPLLLFECVATLLINNCQLWFEYAPFPPISVLAMVENILAEHDQQLLDHFCDIGVTSQTYALKILETAFSEVLTCTEWLILWDHILSNEPAFILMAVVSYNIVQKNALRRLNTHEQLENFFHMQNPIDKKAFLKKAYVLLNETPEEIHPRTYFTCFSSLEKGCSYQQFTGYPKATICLKLAKKQRRKLQDRCTLKELTTDSQQQEINRRYVKSESDIDEENSSGNNLDEYNCFIDGIKGCKKKLSNKNEMIGDHCRNQVKDDLIESIMLPVTTHFERKEKDTKSGKNSRKVHGGSSHCRSHKTMGKRNIVLEKEVEKLIESCSNSDESKD